MIMISLVSVSLAQDCLAEKSRDGIIKQVQILIEEAENSSEWVYIAQTDQGFVGFMNKDRFIVEGDKRRAWTKVFVKNGMSIKNNEDQDKILIYVLNHRIYDCLDSKFSDIKTIHYYSDGSSDSREYSNFYKVYPDKRWTDTVPGTLGDIPLKFVCKYNPS